jgi:anti-sigma B factor antagonist
MDINETVTDGLATLALKGRFLGDKEADEFAEAIRNCLGKGNRKILIDLAGLDYLNSMGLGALLGGYLKTKRAGGLLVFANGNARVTELLSMTKTDTAVPVYATIEAAKKMLVIE